MEETIAQEIRLRPQRHAGIETDIHAAASSQHGCPIGFRKATAPNLCCITDVTTAKEGTREGSVSRVVAEIKTRPEGVRMYLLA